MPTCMHLAEGGGQRCKQVGGELVETSVAQQGAPTHPTPPTDPPHQPMLGVPRLDHGQVFVLEIQLYVGTYAGFATAGILSSGGGLQLHCVLCGPGVGSVCPDKLAVIRSC